MDPLGGLSTIDILTAIRNATVSAAAAATHQVIVAAGVCLIISQSTAVQHRLLYNYYYFKYSVCCSCHDTRSPNFDILEKYYLILILLIYFSRYSVINPN